MDYLLDKYLRPEMGGDYAKALAVAVRWADANAVTMTPGKTYRFASTFVVDSDFRLDMSGATIIAPPAGAVIDTTENRISYLGGRYFQALEGSTRFSVPEEVVLKAGDFVKLESDEIREPTGSYRHGEWVDIVECSNGTAVVARPFLQSFWVDRILVRKHKRQEIFGGTLDFSRTKPLRRRAMAPFGVTLSARDVFVRVDIIGSPFLAVGVKGEGYNVDLGGSVEGIADQHGNNDGVASGRLGYGFAGAGRFVWFFGEAHNCKHGFVTASRSAFGEHVLFDGCSGSTPAGASSKTDDGGKVPLYQGIIDTHANVAQATIRGARLRGCNTLMMLRNPKVRIEDVELVGFDCDKAYGQRGLIYFSESAKQDVIARDVRAISSPDHIGSTTPSLFYWHAVFGNQKLDLDAERINGANHHLFQMSTQKSVATSIEVGKLHFGAVKGSFTGGLIVGCDVQDGRIGRIGSIVLEGADMALSGSGYDRVPLLCVQNFVSVASIEIAGRLDASSLTNGYSAIQIGRDLQMSVGNGWIGNIDAKATVRAYRTAYDIASSNKSSLGRWNFGGSDIRFNAVGDDIGSQSIKTELDGKPRTLDTGNAAVTNLGISNSSQWPQFARVVARLASALKI